MSASFRTISFKFEAVRGEYLSRTQWATQRPTILSMLQKEIYGKQYVRRIYIYIKSLKIEYVHQHTTLATKVKIQGGGPLPVWQSKTPAGHDSSPSRDFAYIAPRSIFSGFKSL